MSMTKFASFDCSEILSVKGSQERVKTASLSKLADFDDFRTEDGYLYARIRAISSRVNKNHDGWPSIELAGGQDVFDKHRQASKGEGFVVQASKGAEYGFSTFLGKPIFVDHHNSNPERARGVIVDAALHVEDHKTAAENDPYYASAPDNHMPPTWVELLLEVDANSFPKFAKAIIEGGKDSSNGIDGFSMGCDVENSICNICKHSAVSPDEFCSHIRMKGALHNYRDETTGERKTAKSYEDCYGIRFFEISGVFDPADETALTREIRSAVLKESHGEEIDPNDPILDVLVPHPPVDDVMTRAGEIARENPEIHFADAYRVAERELQGDHPSPVRGGDGAVAEGLKRFNADPLPDNLPRIHQHNDPYMSKTAEITLPCEGCRGAGVNYLANEAVVPCNLCGGQGSSGVQVEPPVARGGDGALTPGRLGPSDTSGPNDAITDAVLESGRPMRPNYGKTANLTMPCPACKGAGSDLSAGSPPGFEAPCGQCGGSGASAQFDPGGQPGGDGAQAPHTLGPNQILEMQPNRGGPTAEVLQHGQETGQLPMSPNYGSAHTADNPAPQVDMTKAPRDINTLREEKLCPICATALEDGSCGICGYVEPPEHFNNPDLTKAQETNDIPQVSGPDGAPQQQVDNTELNPALLRNAPQQKPMPLASVKGDMQWNIVSHPHLAGRINPVERPVNPGGAATTNEPNETVIKDEHAPVTSKLRTAREMIAAVGRDKENNMKVADSPEAVSAPDVSTDTTGIGGVMDASNEEASKADAQVDVGAKGGTGVEDVSADKTDHVDHGDEHTKNIEGTPTDQWTGTDGNGVTKQTEPVQGDVFPASDEGVKKSHEHESLDSEAFPKDDGDLSGGSAVQGVQPIAESFGDRVDVLKPVTTPANNSGPTTQWTGTDGNGVTKQQEPVTNVVATPFTSKVVNVFKLADLEIALGLLPESEKYARVTELGEKSDYHVMTELAYAQRVRTAGLSKKPKAAAVKEAKRLPVLGHASAPHTPSRTSVVVDEDDPLKGTLFGG